MRKSVLYWAFAVAFLATGCIFGGEYEDELARVREELFARYQEEARRGVASAGTRAAWFLVRVGSAGGDARIDLSSFRHDESSAEIRARYRGADAFVRMGAADLGKRVRAVVDGYVFIAGNSILLQKPLSWMAEMARAFREAGVAPDRRAEWELMEAPGGLIALAGADAPEEAFFQGAVRHVESLPSPADFETLREDFRRAAEALHKGILADETIPLDLRRALEPVLAGTYNPVDPRDYFDSDFCRRLIEADYLERLAVPIPLERAAELETYRRTLAAIEAGIDRFAVDLGMGERLVAVSRPNIDSTADSTAGDARDVVVDPETGETLSRYHWRLERGDATFFHSPLPSRYLYALSVMEEFPGRHAARPKGVPENTVVWHAVLGNLAAYEAGAQEADGDAERWLEAVRLDATGGRDPSAGPLGWSFPLFVPVRNEQGDPVLIATGRGIVPGPDFAAVGDATARRAAQEKWLEKTAAVLAAPGELNLVYRIFFRYCSDSPLPEMPNLIGSHLGLSDTHQTVYQTLDRRWAGRLAGDCDDMAEFFQNLAARQGRLVHVMQLPSHAAAGWLDEAPDVGDAGGYEFVVLQTGPALRFTSETRLGAVEKAYRHFENSVGESQFSSSAVPVLLRFADEDTRTPFVLSARIYWDRAYSDAMITVQGYWHLYTFSAAIAAMERMIAAGDNDPGNLKELASLYEQVGEFDKAVALRGEEAAAAGGDDLAALSALLDMAGLRTRAKEKAEALDALDQMRARLDALRVSAPALYAQAFAYRSAWAGLLARLGEPERAWALMQYDVAEAEADGWRVSDPLLRTLVVLYERMAIQRDEGGADPSASAEDIRFSVRGALSHAFGAGYFRADDSFNKLQSKYYWLGRYAVAVAGRKAGLELLAQDGPYPAGASRAARAAELSEEDWAWFRVMPRLYLSLGLEMLDREEFPERYNPAEAQLLLGRLVARAAEKGGAVGAGLVDREAVIQAALADSFVRNDLAAFTALMEGVRDKDYSSLYDVSASLFGSLGGLAPLEEFEPWVAAFHTYFPGRQNYFKAAYRLMNKGHYDHAVRFARAAAAFFPDDALLADEARALETYAADLRATLATRPGIR